MVSASVWGTEGPGFKSRQPDQQMCRSTSLVRTTIGDMRAEKVQVTLSADGELKTFAKANPIDTFALEFSAKFKSAILDTEAHTQRLYNLLLTNPELAAMIESEVMKATYHSMRNESGRRLSPDRETAKSEPALQSV